MTKYIFGKMTIPESTLKKTMELILEKDLLLKLLREEKLLVINERKKNL